MNKAFLEKTDREKVIKIGTATHLNLINYLTGNKRRRNGSKSTSNLQNK